MVDTDSDYSDSDSGNEELTTHANGRQKPQQGALSLAKQSGPRH